MSSKRWAQEGDKHVLYFTPFYDEKPLAELELDSYGWWIRCEFCKAPRLLYRESSDALELAKEEAEEMIADHYTDQRDYYAALLAAFEEA